MAEQYVDPFDALLAEQQFQQNQGRYIDPFDKLIQQEEAVQPVLGIDPVGAAYEAGKFIYEMLPTRQPQERPMLERAQEVGQSATIGGGIGAFAPNVMEATGRGIQRLPIAGAPIVGRVLEETGKNLGKSSKTSRASYGAIGAGSGEAVGQVVTEATDKPVLGFAADVASGTFVTPVMRAGEIVWGFAGRAARALARASDVQQEAKTFTNEIAKIRRGEESYLPAQNVTEALERGASQYEIDNITRLDSDISNIQSKLKSVQDEANKAYMTIGKPLEKSEVGDMIRGTIQPKYTRMLEKRAEQYQIDLAARNKVVSDQEAAGKFVTDIPEYKTLQKELENKLLIGLKAKTTPTKQVADPNVEKAYSSLYTALKDGISEISEDEFAKLSAQGLRTRRVSTPEGDKFYRVYPNSFEALDDVRRKLGDAAFGKDAEGYAALGQNIAKDLYGKISNIQLQYAGDAHKVLQGNYEEASELLTPFKAMRGKKVTAVDRVNPKEFSEDVANLPNKFFSSRQGAKDLIALTEDYGKAEQIARSHVTRELQDMDAKQVKKYLTDPKTADFLNAFPSLKKEMVSFAGKLQQSDLLTDSLTKKVDDLVKEQDTVRKTAQGIKGDALRPSARVEYLLKAEKNDKVLTEISRIISQDSVAREAFPQAVRQFVANNAGENTLKLWQGEIAPMLTKTNLLSKAEIDGIGRDVAKLMTSIKNKDERASLLSVMLFNALNTAVSTAPSRAKEYNEFYKNQPLGVFNM
jgi:hypothetical protein